MKAKKSILCLFCLTLTVTLFAQEQDRKNIFGFGVGISPAKQAWIGNPANFWADLNSGTIFHIFYQRQVLEAVRLGSYFEYESTGFTSSNDKVSRYNVGVNWIAQYPKTDLHLQLGGYFGYGTLAAENWDQSVSGIDYGIIIGPAYEKNHFGVAVHLQTGFGYYLSSGAPDEVDFSIPRFVLKVYYKL